MLIFFAAALPAAGQEYRVTDANSVYYGDAGSFSSPATLELSEVFSHIAPYQRIVEEGLNEDDAEYWTLLERANRIFERILETLARNGGYDLIAEVGAVETSGGASPAPVVTDEASELAESFGDG